MHPDEWSANSKRTKALDPLHTDQGFCGKRRARRGSAGLGGQLFLDAGGLAAQVAQVIELGPAHVAAALDRDAVDGGAVALEHTFHALAVGDLAHGEGGIQAAVAHGDNDAFEGLQAFAFAFLHLHDNGVAKCEAGRSVRICAAALALGPLQFRHCECRIP